MGVAELAWRPGRGEWNGDTLQGEDGIPVWGVAIIYLYRLKAKWGSFGRLQRPTGLLGLDAFPGQESFGSSILDELIQSTLKPDQPATQDAQNTSCSSPPPLTAQGSFTGEFKGNSG